MPNILGKFLSSNVGKAAKNFAWPAAQGAVMTHGFDTLRQMSGAEPLSTPAWLTMMAGLGGLRSPMIPGGPKIHGQMVASSALPAYSGYLQRQNFGGLVSDPKVMEGHISNFAEKKMDEYRIPKIQPKSQPSPQTTPQTQTRPVSQTAELTQLLHKRLDMLTKMQAERRARRTK